MFEELWSQASTPSQPDDWRGDFQSAEARLLDASLAATPFQRLRWLAEAPLAFAMKMGALGESDAASSPRDCE